MAKLNQETRVNIPAELKDLRQWVLWDWKDKGNGERTKVPIQVGRTAPASSTDSSTWDTYEDAWAAYVNQWGAGIGFVFTAEDNYIGVDFDACLVDGVLREPEATWVRLLNSYTEVSPSGTGVKVILRGKLPEGTRHGFGKGNGIYESGRFFTITGHAYGDLANGAKIRSLQPHELRPLLDVWFPEQQRTVTWEPQPERFTDNEVLRKLLNAGNGAKALDLSGGQWEGYYPSKSEADAGLLSMLAFYTGPNPAQLDRLFRSTKLLNEKWDEQRGTETYGEKTIRYVLDNTETYYGGVAAVAADEWNPDGDAVPVPAASRVPARTWAAKLDGYPALEGHERPWALNLLCEHIAPLSSGFVSDWAEMSVLGFISALFPEKRFQNLPLGVWTLGISEQATGKSLVADELAELTLRISAKKTTGYSVQPLAKYGGGSTAGMIRRLEGNGRGMLAYFSEWSSFMSEMERDFGSTMKDTLLNLYDGRSYTHVLAQETIQVDNPRLVVAGVTTSENWIRTGSLSGISDGFYSRLLFFAPDTWTNWTPLYDKDMPHHREKLVNVLSSHWSTLPEFGDCAFVSGEEPHEDGTFGPYYAYKKALGLVDDGPRRIRSLDDAMLRTSEHSTPAGRSLVKVKKLAALLALCEREPDVRRNVLWIHDSHILLAIRLVQRSNAYASRVFGYLGRSKDENQASAVRLALSRNGALKIGAVMHESALDRDKATRALDLLVDDGEAETYIVDGVRHWRLK